MTDINTLKALAEAATPGRWEVERDDLFFYEDGYTKHLMETSEGSDFELVDHRANLRFIAAANPAAVLELIFQIERLERKNANQSESIREYQDLVMGGDVSLGMLKADLRVTAGERDELKAENERLQSFETAYKEYSDKTDWVQENAHWSELGMHRADVLRKRCDDAASQMQAQAEQLKKLMAENEMLRKLLLEASEEVASWGAYASEYFQEKHDLAGCVARLHDAAMSKEASHD